MGHNMFTAVCNVLPKAGSESAGNPAVRVTRMIWGVVPVPARGKPDFGRVPDWAPGLLVPGRIPGNPTYNSKQKTAHSIQDTQYSTQHHHHSTGHHETHTTPGNVRY